MYHGILKSLPPAQDPNGDESRRPWWRRGSDGFIECHHVEPVHALRAGDKTRLGDLRLLYSNCHRMVHAKRSWLTIDELVTIIRQPMETGGPATEHP
jgi:hypothetical protein